MARYFLAATVLVLASLALINQVEAKDWGKVTCSGTTKKPSLKLIGAFLTAGCPIPVDGSDDAFGNTVRCVLKHLEVYTEPSTFSQAKAEEVILPVFPKKYAEGLKTKLSGCFKKHSKACKPAKTDSSGKSFGAMFKCFEEWYNDKLCT